MSIPQKLADIISQVDNRSIGVGFKVLAALVIKSHYLLRYNAMLSVESELPL
jgi:hypothetical protein